MIIKEEIYINTNRDFYSDYVSLLDITARIVFTHKETQEVIEFDQVITLPNEVNRYFIIPLVLADFEYKGFYMYSIYLDNLVTDEEDLYESGLALYEYDEADIFSDEEGDEDVVFVDND